MIMASAPSLSDNDRKLDIIINNQNELTKTLARIMEKMEANDMAAAQKEGAASMGTISAVQKKKVAPPPVIDDNDDNDKDDNNNDNNNDKNDNNNDDQDGGKRPNKRKSGKRHNKTVIQRLRKPSRLQSQKRRA